MIIDYEWSSRDSTCGKSWVARMINGEAGGPVVWSALVHELADWLCDNE